MSEKVKPESCDECEYVGECVIREAIVDSEVDDDFLGQGWYCSWGKTKGADE